MSNMGMNIAAQTMHCLMAKYDVVANNLANAATVGFKSDAMLFESFAARFNQALNRVSGGVTIAAVQPRLGQGSLRVTDNALDVALEGNGFFVVQTPDGERLTRQGNFTLDAAGQLTTQSGDAVMGEDGPITITGGVISINAAGEIIVDGATTGRLRIVDVDEPAQLRKTGQTQFAVRSEEALRERPEQTRVQSGALEQADVSTIKEMVDMIETLRLFEMNQKVVMTIDETRQRAIAEVGRTR